MEQIHILISLLVIHISVAFAAPSGGKTSLDSADVEKLRTAIVELENAVYRLKDFSRSLEETLKSRGDYSPDFGKGRSRDPEDELPNSSSSKISAQDEVSLKEAIEYLVALAKEKKQDKRDHDIPFPLSEKTRD